MMWTRASLRQALDRRGLAPRRGLGQHFLVDPRVCRAIVDAGALPPGADVLEIGCGPGLLTAHLAPAAGRVLAVDVDPDMVALCREAVAEFPNVEVLEKDILDPEGRIQAPWSAEGEALHVFGNLPYNISVDILIALLAWDHPVAQILTVLQREVADRLRARPRGEQYGPLSVVAQAFAEVEVLRRIPPSVFWPAPRVESALVRLRPRPGRASRVRPAWEALRLLFRSRRKRLGGAMKALAGSESERRDALAKAGVSPDDRAEALPPEALIGLVEFVSS